jgi:hypothetical protein
MCSVPHFDRTRLQQPHHTSKNGEVCVVLFSQQSVSSSRSLSFRRQGNAIVLVLVNSAKDEYKFSASSVKCWGRLIKLNDERLKRIDAFAGWKARGPHQRGIFGEVFSVQVDS